MPSINEVQILGHLGKDAEVRVMPESKREVVNLVVCTSESWKDKVTGERKEKAEWHYVVIFKEHLVALAKTLKKGMLIQVRGALRTRKWLDVSKNIDRYKTEIVLEGFYSQLWILTPKAREEATEAKHTEVDDFTPAYVEDLDEFGIPY